MVAAAQMRRRRWCPSIFQGACCFFFWVCLENWKMKRKRKKKGKGKGKGREGKGKGRKRKALGGIYMYVYIYRFPAPRSAGPGRQPHHPLTEQIYPLFRGICNLLKYVCIKIEK